MTMVACSRCGTQAFDNDAQSSFAKLKVEDATCAYFVDPRGYSFRCQFVRDSSRVESFSTTDNACPHMKEKIASRADWRLGVFAT
jgi:hypothetical protein